MTQATDVSRRTRVLILGAAGRDFHDFNVVYRDDPRYEVVAFTAAQIPDIAGRCYPAVLAGPLYPQGIPIFDEADAWTIVREQQIDEVVFAYSDLSHEDVMHKASRAVAGGASFRLLGARETMLKASKPVVSVCAVRTGCGKSVVTRRIAAILRERGQRVAVVRHPMPYGDLAAQAVQRFASLEDISSGHCTVEEREEYEPHVTAGDIVFAGVDYSRILHAAEAEADVIVWDGGNNDLPFFLPDLEIVLADPHRVGQETRYFPGEANLLRADVIVLTKVDTASHLAVSCLREEVAKVNPAAQIIEAAMPLSVPDPGSIRGARVLAVEDGPTLTHGGMSYGAATMVAHACGALQLVDPAPYAVGTIKNTFAQYKSMGPLLPAVGYSDRQLSDLQATIADVPCDLVLIGTPIDLGSLIRIDKPSQRVTYGIQERNGPSFTEVIDVFLSRMKS